MALTDFANSNAKLLNVAQETAEVGAMPHKQRRARMLAQVSPVIGLVILMIMAGTMLSQQAVWKRESVQNTSDSAGQALQLSGDANNKHTCRRATGGTCFITACAANRGNTSCDVDLGISIFGWHSCNCKYPTPCAHSDGKCYAHPEEGWRQRLQGESELTILFALAPVMRSGVTTLFSHFLALDHLVRIPSAEPVKVDFDTFMTWDDVRMGSNFKYYWQAIVVSTIKAVGLHAMQPFLFILPYVAYSRDMGWIQFASATFVVLNELLYLFIIPVAIYVNSKWLLYAPLSDTNGPRAVVYFVAPATCIIAMISDQLPEILDLFTSRCGVFASLCAWVALAVGLVGNGVMFPSLLIGYMLSAVELPAFALLKLFT